MFGFYTRNGLTLKGVETLRHFRRILRCSRKPARVMVSEALNWLELVLYNCKAQLIKYDRWYWPGWRTVKPVTDFLHHHLYVDPIGVAPEKLARLRSRECELRLAVLKKVMPRKAVEGDDGKSGTP